eukprot:659139-Amphidinium_carterae.1
MALRALRAYKEEGEGKCRGILRKCNGWEIDAEDDMHRLLRSLAKIYQQAHEVILIEELQADDDAEHGTRHYRSRREFVQRQLRRWKASAITRAVPTIAIEGIVREDMAREEQELGCLRSLWQDIYRETPIPHSAPLDELLVHAPQVHWPSLQIRADVVDCIRHLPDTGAGPDGLTYKMISGLEEEMVPVIQRTFEGVARGDWFSAEWRRCATALIPKLTGP